MTGDESDAVAGQHRVGRWMLLAGWLIFIVLLAWLFQSILQKQFNPNAEITTASVQGGREIVLKRNRAGHYVATGTINGHEVVFLLDTGATSVAVPGVLADHLGLPRGMELISQTANGDAQAWSTQIDTVALGGIQLNDVRASILPGMSGDEVLLGMSFLKHLELVQRGDELKIRQY